MIRVQMCNVWMVGILQHGLGSSHEHPTLNVLWDVAVSRFIGESEPLPDPRAVHGVGNTFWGVGTHQEPRLANHLVILERMEQIRHPGRIEHLAVFRTGIKDVVGG